MSLIDELVDATISIMNPTASGNEKQDKWEREQLTKKLTEILAEHKIGEVVKPCQQVGRFRLYNAKLGTIPATVAILRDRAFYAGQSVKYIDWPHGANKHYTAPWTTGQVTDIVGDRLFISR